MLEVRNGKERISKTQEAWKFLARDVAEYHNSCYQRSTVPVKIKLEVNWEVIEGEGDS
jgi:hypothetical protein